MLFLNSFKSLNISEEAPNSEYSQTYADMTAIKCTWLHGWKLGWGDRRAQDEKTEAKHLSFDRAQRLGVGKSRLCAFSAEAGAGRLNLGHQLSKQQWTVFTSNTMRCHISGCENVKVSISPPG